MVHVLSLFKGGGEGSLKLDFVQVVQLSNSNILYWPRGADMSVYMEGGLNDICALLCACTWEGCGGQEISNAHLFDRKLIHKIKYICL